MNHVRPPFAPAATTRLVWLLGLLPALACESSTEAGSSSGTGGTTTAYLTCGIDTDACKTGAACTAADGTTTCVALPDSCDGKLSCECLGKTACGTGTCSDSSGGKGLVCGGGADTCVPGDTFADDDGCNTCTCPLSGQKADAQCTAMACEAPECTPGETFTADDGCNTCTCPESGKKADAACTEKACVDPDACAPGESFTADDGCNTCVCPESGKKAEAGCTDMACVDPDACVPGESFPAPDGCNTCYCPESGKKSEAGCTKIACLGPDECVPGETFAADDGCNKCTCPESGMKVDAACTKIACPPKDECVPGESFPADDGCNTCYCPESGKKSDAGCTKIACPPKDECIPGESFPADDGCNTCYCPVSGKKAEASCTEMACVDPKACVPGESFPAGDGCNTCTCTDTGMKADALCTLKACAPVQCAPTDGGTPTFPEPPDSCNGDADCVVVFHQINCCGTQVAWGIAKEGQVAHEAAEALCGEQYPKCGCPQFMTTADDGATGWEISDFVAWCDAGTCKSAGVGGCSTEKECTNGQLCISPGASIGCGICMQDPVTCTADADCGAGSVCLESTVADCLCVPSTICKPSCQQTGCAEGQTCGADGHCAAQTCSADSLCPKAFDCKGGSCVRRACSASSDCDGTCVNGMCYATPGTCSYLPP